MARQSNRSIDLFHIDFQQPPEMKFNRARLRRAFVAIGQKHMRDARILVAKRETSRPGQNPAHRSGKLSRSIGYFVPKATGRRPGLMVRIAPNQKKGEKNRLITEAFYPAFLHYGVKRGAKRRRSHHRGASGGLGWRIAPRSNYMAEVLRKNKPWTRFALLRELRLSLKAVRR